MDLRGDLGSKAVVVCELMVPLSLGHYLDLKELTSWFSLITAGETATAMLRRQFMAVNFYSIKRSYPSDAFKSCRDENKPNQKQ